MDYRLLQRLRLAQNLEVPCAGLTVIVGPNSGGKTRLLRDIHAAISGESHQFVVATHIEVEKPVNLDAFVAQLEESGFIGNSGVSHTRTITPQRSSAGVNRGNVVISFNQANQWWNSFSATKFSGASEQDSFLKYFGQLLTAALFIDQRLTSMIRSGRFNITSEGPGNDMQAVNHDRQAASSLEAEILRSFGKHVWIDAAGGQEIVFRTWDKGRPPTFEERLDGKTMHRCRTVENEGDGLKSYLAIGAALVLGPSAVCLVDEPELCLHPPQAFNLGRFIGRHAGNAKNANFVATHSSQVLRGILNSGAEMRVLRVSRSADQFQAKVVSAEDVRKHLGKPTVRAETILDGFFAQAVVLVEAEGDRIVYQAAWQSSSGAATFDIHFAPIGGTGAADACSLYKMLDIPTAVVADLDLISAPGRFAKIVRALDRGPAGDRVCEAADELLRKVNVLGAAKAVADARAELDLIVGSASDMSEETLVARLGDVVKSIKPSARFKRPVAELPDAERDLAQELVGNAAKLGLFLVPVGVLENWLAGVAINASKARKQEWALSAAAYVEAAPPRADDVWAFTQVIANYLGRTIRSTSSD